MSRLLHKKDGEFMTPWETGLDMAWVSLQGIQDRMMAAEAENARLQAEVKKLSGRRETKTQIRFSVGQNTQENHELAEMLATIDGATYVDILSNGEIWITANGKQIKLKTVVK